MSSEPPHVHSAYCAGKLAWSDLARHPALLPDPVEPAAAGERHKDDEKAIAFLAPALGARISRGFPVRAVVLPRVSQRARTTLVPITAARALLASAPSTVLQLPGDGRAAFDGIGRLVRQVPSFQLDLGRDRAAIPQVVAAVLEQA